MNQVTDQRRNLPVAFIIPMDTEEQDVSPYNDLWTLKWTFILSRNLFCFVNAYTELWRKPEDWNNEQRTDDIN